jgi:hypothetical protein
MSTEFIKKLARIGPERFTEVIDLHAAGNPWWVRPIRGGVGLKVERVGDMELHVAIPWSEFEEEVQS